MLGNLKNKYSYSLVPIPPQTKILLILIKNYSKVKIKLFPQFIIYSNYTKVHSNGLTSQFTLVLTFHICSSLKSIILLDIEAQIWLVVRLLFICYIIFKKVSFVLQFERLKFLLKQRFVNNYLRRLFKKVLCHCNN